MKAETVATSVPVKILCGCGQKYSFEAEPVDGGMGYAVQCPVCASDGTAAANQVIALHLAGQATPTPGIQFNPSVLAPTMPRPPSRSTGQNNFPLNAKRKWVIPLITATFVLLVAAAVLLGRTRHQRMDLVVLSNDATAPTLKEINARYVEPPAGQNAADFYLQGFDSMRVEDVSLLKVPLLGSGKLPPLGSTRSGLALVLGVAGVDISPGEHEAITARIQKGDHFKDEQQFLKKAGHQFMAARKEAFPERLKAEQLIHALVKEAGEKQFLISKHLLGGLAAPVLKEAGSLAQARLGLTALALEQFRATHENKYPSALSALTPDYLATIPADPFDGQPLRYRLKANGYLLYSIGPDLKDDSGDPIIGKNGDIVFMVVQTPKPL